MAFGGNSTPFGGASGGGLFGNSTPFGASSPPAAQQRPAFGVGPTPAFGAAAAAPSAFGAPAAGATGAFGAQPAQGGLFGGAPATGGLFGAPAQTPAAGGLFGAPASAPAFGAQPGAAFGGGNSGAFAAASTPSYMSTPAFGAASASAFGAPAAGAFGQPATGAFGAPAAPAAGASAFGAPASSGAGVFGGGGGLFGAQRPAATGAFGAAATPAAGAGAFGQQASAFGTPAAAGGGLFGGAATPGAAAGQPGAPGRGTAGVPWTLSQESEGNPPAVAKFQTITMMPIFKNRCMEELRIEDYAAGNRPGAAAQTPTTPAASPFGAQPQPQTGLAGGGAFGQAATGFGTPGQPAAPATGFGAFGATPAPSSGGLFGAKPAQPASGGLFGSAPATTGVFGGGAAASPFRQPAATPAASGTGLFGAAQPAAAASQPSLFGAPASQPGFGQSQPSLFGQPTAATAAAQQPGSLFGGAAATPTPGFGQSQPSLFGSTAPTPGLSLGAQSGSSLFGGGAAAQPSAFGQTPAPAAGTPSPFGISSGFGATATPTPAGGGLFLPAPQSAPASLPGLGLSAGSAPASGGLFGNMTPAASVALGQSSSGLFGSSGGLGSGGGFGNSGGFGGGFGGASASAFGGGGFGGGANFGQPQNQQQQQANGQLPPLVASIDANPYGTPAWFSAALSTMNTAGGAKAPPSLAAARGSSTTRRQAESQRPMRRGNRLRTRTRTSALRGGRDMSLFETSLSGSSMFASAIDLGTPSSRPRFGDLTGFQRSAPQGDSSAQSALQRSSRAASLKKLIIRPRQAGSDSPDSGFGGSSARQIAASPFLHASGTPVVRNDGGLNTSRRELQFDTPLPGSQQRAVTQGDNAEGEGLVSPAFEKKELARPPSLSEDGRTRSDAKQYPVYGKRSGGPAASSAPDPDQQQPTDEETSAGGDQYDQIDEESIEVADDDAAHVAHSKLKEEDGLTTLAGAEGARSPCPISTKPEVFTRPSLQELAGMTDEELLRVPEFCIGVEDVGLVEWPGETDVRYLNIDRDVSIKAREVVVYPDDSSRPPVDAGLNKRAHVSLHGLWKRDKETKYPIKNASGAAAMVKKLKAHCDSQDLVFLGYDVSTGTWSFETPHF